MDLFNVTMKGVTALQSKMTPPLEGCGFIYNDPHAYGYAISPPDVFHDPKPATPESLLFPSPDRRASIATNTTTSGISINTNTQSAKQPTPCDSDSFASPRQPRDSKTVQDIVFSPRPNEDIHAERAYLSSSLHKQCLHAEGLFRDYSTVQHQLQACQDSGTNGRIRRHLKKRLSLLKFKIINVGTQTRAIGSRLGELGVELQSREVWDREGQRCYSPLLLDTSGYCLGSWSEDGQSMLAAGSLYYAMPPEPLQTALSPFSPSFVPWSAFPWSLAEKKESGIDAVLFNSKNEVVIEEFASNRGLVFSYCCEADTDDVEADGEDRRQSLGDVGSATLPKRRLSLPNMSSLWL